MSDTVYKRHPKSASFGKKFGTKARVGRHTWKIVYCSTLVWNGREIVGLCTPGDRRIYVCIYENVNTQETLIHELLHAECYEAGLRQMPIWSENTEELICEAASRVLSNYDIRRRRS
jgi:hypothetical protein